MGFKYPVSTGDFKVDVAAGNVDGAQSLVRYGHRGSIASFVTADLWSGPTLALQRLSSAERMSLVSDDIADASGGTGANRVIISGVDDNFNPLIEEVTLNGTVPVLTVGTYLRVNAIVVSEVGSGGTNAGQITATAEIAGTVQNVIEVGYGFSSSSHYTIPVGRRGVIQTIGGAATRGDDVSFSLSVSPPGLVGDGYAVALEAWAPASVQDLNLGLAAGTDVKLTATAISNNINCSAYYSLMLVPN